VWHVSLRANADKHLKDVHRAHQHTRPHAK
jgi:hypothetical protein